jgi:YggT family protein
MCSLVRLIDFLLDLYSWVLIAYVVVSLLMSFGVVNAYNRFVNVLFDMLQRVTEPLLRPIRRILPDTGPLDLSPLVLYLAIWLARMLLAEYAFRPACLGI